MNFGNPISRSVVRRLRSLQEQRTLVRLLLGVLAVALLARFPLMGPSRFPELGTT